MLAAQRKASLAWLNSVAPSELDDCSHAKARREALNSTGNVIKLNKNAIYKGAVEGGMSKNDIICAQDLTEAAAEIRRLAVAGDAILYENDLPDTFK